MLWHQVKDFMSKSSLKLSWPSVIAGFLCFEFVLILAGSGAYLKGLNDGYQWTGYDFFYFFLATLLVLAWVWLVQVPKELRYDGAVLDVLPRLEKRAVKNWSELRKWTYGKVFLSLKYEGYYVRIVALFYTDSSVRELVSFLQREFPEKRSFWG